MTERVILSKHFNLKPGTRRLVRAAFRSLAPELYRHKAADWVKYGRHLVDEIIAGATLHEGEESEGGAIEQDDDEPKPEVRINVSFKPRMPEDMDAKEIEDIYIVTTGRTKKFNDPELAVRVHPCDLENGIILLELVHRFDMRVDGKDVININGGCLSLSCREIGEEEQADMFLTAIRVLKSAGSSSRVVELSHLPKLRAI